MYTAGFRQFLPDIQNKANKILLHEERSNMTYDQFVQAVERKVNEETDDDIAVCIHTAVKNNGRERKGIRLTKRGINISPAIYLEEYYEQFRSGGSVEDAAKDILRLYDEVRFSRSWEKDTISDYVKVKEKIVYHLVNKEKNETMLSDTPYVPYLDMAAVFYVLLEANAYGTAAMMVKNEHLMLWNVTEEEIYRQACRNTERLLPYEFRTMKEVIAELTGSKEDTGKDVMYVLSNTIRSFGAAAVLYDGVLAYIGSCLKENYYVLPSSVHEVIIIPESEAPGREELSAMVAEINAAEVEEEDVLSDNAYYYDRKLKKLQE
ncbi:hypothetical protein HMPREF0980_00482 [Dorea sp. D27]|nr:hypothetical protein HMPREF0980_00482 [Dorea sp. D27]